MLSLEKVAVKITSFNPRAETHGNDKVAAADIKFEMRASNEVLSEFGSQLRESLYWKNTEPVQPEPGENGELEVSSSDKPNLRNPMLAGPLKINKEIVGAVVTIEWGATGKGNIVLGDCEVNNFSVDPHEGGTVIVGFRVQCHPDEKAAGKLCQLVQQETVLTLEPPEAEPDFVGGKD